MLHGSQAERVAVASGELVALYRHMVVAREVDALEERLVNRGLAAFHVSGAGHEAVAAFAPHLAACDWIHGHYRDKALMLARGLPLRTFFDNLFCSGASPSRGRQMSAHISWRPGHVLSLTGPVGNNALQAVGVAAEVVAREGQPVVLCCLGDGTTQQGEVMEAIAEAVRAHLPVLFLIENNALAISTVTSGRTFFSLPGFDATEFMGLPIRTVDGADSVLCARVFGEVVREVRVSRGPALVVMDVERLANHTHADDQRQYRPALAMAGLARRDPLLRLRGHLAESGVAEADLRRIEDEAVARVGAAAAVAQRDRHAPMPMLTAKRALPERVRVADDAPGPLTMAAAITEVLRRRLRADPRVTLYGQDIEDPKGDVFGVTRGLSTEFGRRVENAPLSEATIVGKAVGRALAGGRPVAFLQFADFLPLAFNQIASEMASLHWRTDGEWDAPVIVMAPCGGYRQGLGPFHAQSFEAIACHVPGLDVVCPATAADAWGLLEAAFESGRPTLFFYPKALLNDPAVALAAGASPFVELGKAAIARAGADISLVSYGNGVKLCLAAADWLAQLGLTAEVVDLRSLSPLDEESVLRSARKTGRLVVVHEDVGTCGLASEIVARVAEKAPGVAVARVVRAETFVPCNFANQLAVLPSARDVLDAAARLLDVEVTWSDASRPVDGVLLVRAAGSPSDETVTLLECHVAAGDRVREGDLLATFETVKAAVEFEAPAGGTVETLFAAVGDVVKVGEPFLSLAVGREQDGCDRLEETSLTPTLRLRPAKPTARGHRRDAGAAQEVGILAIATRLGSESVVNADLVGRHPGRSARDVERLTGIATRWRAAPGETALTLGADAARRALAQAGLAITDIDAVICATGTPGLATPSLACRILHELAGRRYECQAHDVSAACTGYLYALQAAYDLVQATPHARVLVVTSELLTPLVDDADFETGLLFSDGASATVLGGAGQAGKLVLSRPVLSAAGEPGRYLTVPGTQGGTIAMDGGKIFASAVKTMADMLLRACAAQGCGVGDLDLVVPHQANQRILDAVASRLGLPAERVASNIRAHGNTSSSTIPICLADHWSDLAAGQRIGLTAFGGGFTYGAALLVVR